MEDNRILELYWKRQEAAITRTAEKYGRYCQTISYNILHNREDAEECVNDTWFHAWNSMPPHYPNRLSAYLGKITRNLSINRFKSYGAGKRGGGQAALVLSELADCIPAAGGVEDVVEEMVLVDAIEMFLYGLTEQKRNIFIRRYWYLTPVKELARTYRMSEGKVASMLFRMRRELKEHLEKEGIVL
ncbi:MAG: sigma-70 family RNA polymerase sigma factor [Lachnospiraceae bacterium]|jgi:RNA polymerase sigma factor (sigma-70 family)|nr:sigma-70 family RNA polymerase sigma factor [Lachnospiraceae bacterium]